MNLTPELIAFQRQPMLYENVVGDLIAGWPQGGVFVDGGAHMGLHTEPMLRRADVSRVYAIEAIPALCGSLRTRFLAADKLTLVEAAVGRETGAARFQVAVDAPGYSGLLQRPLEQIRHWESIDVQVVTLDGIMGGMEVEPVGLIKLDLEGGELDAIRGGMGIVQRGRPLIIFENGLRPSAAQYGYQWEDFAGTFETLDYDVRDFFGNSVDKAYWDATLQTYMFVAVPREGEGLRWLDEHLPTVVARYSLAPAS